MMRSSLQHDVRNAASKVSGMTDQPKARILVVDDEQMLLDMVTDALTFAGYSVTAVADGLAALSSVRNEQPDLVILDVNMPEPDGFQVARSLRASYPNLPVLFLTARSEIDDLRTGFESGGDDYLTKPFRLEELRLRVGALLRRAGPADRSHILTCGDLTLNDKKHIVTRGTDQIQLSPVEYRLLHYLISNAGQVMERAQILEAVWGYEYGDSVLETAISQLRKKVDEGRPKLIHTIRGFGYSLRAPNV